MELLARTKDLADSFALAMSVVPVNSPKPLLQNVYFQFKKDDSYFSANDSEIAIRVNIPEIVTGIGDGEVLLPGVRTAAVFKELSDDNTKLKIGERKIVIKNGYDEFNLQISDDEGFPAVDSFDWEKEYYTLACAHLKTGLKHTIIAADSTAKSQRYVCESVRFDFTSSKARFVATDGRKLSWCEFDLEVNGDVDDWAINQILLPKKAVATMLRCISDSGTCKIKNVGSRLGITDGKVTIYTSLVSGRHPNWGKVVSFTKKPISFSVVCAPFEAAMRRATLVTQAETRGVDFHITKGMLKLNSEGAEVGNSEVTMPIPYEGKDVMVRLDPLYIIEFLKTLDKARQIEFEMSSKDDAVQFNADNLRYVVMPQSTD